MVSVPPHVDISVRESEVLAAVGAGLSNAQIARRLHISVRTVEGHISSLLRKCGVAGRQELAAIAETSSVAPPGQIAGVPQYRTSFVGRAKEREAVLAALAESGLVTLVGPGGAGKTRLAAVVADAAAPGFPFGSVFVDLVPVGAEFLTQAVAAALGVAERPHQTLRRVILERLGRGRCLLVLDNCEHIADAVVDVVEDVLSACPEAVVLATSRERLGIPGERVVPVPPLPLSSEAEQLFRERAAAADPAVALDPDLVSDICARLDGLPLAIELAAARYASLGTGGLLTGLGDYLRLLAGGRGKAVRHRSLRAVIDWSHNLLDEEERTFFRRLAVFAGSFDLQAMVAVASGPAGDDTAAARAADVLGRLVDKSLAVRLPDSGGRWRLLETVRAFAREQLEHSGELPMVRRRYLRWAADTATDLEAGPAGDFETVADNLREALTTAAPAVAEGPDEDARRLAQALGRLTFGRRFVRESIGHFRQAALWASTAGQAHQALSVAADCAQMIEDADLAFQLRRAAAERARAAHDGDAEAIALARAVELACRYPYVFAEAVPRVVLRRLLDDAAAAGDLDDPEVRAWVGCARAWNAGDAELAPDGDLARIAAEAARRSGDPVLISACLDAVRTAALNRADVRAAHSITTERLALLTPLGSKDPDVAAELTDALSVACGDAVAAGALPAALAVARLLEGDDLHRDHPFLTPSKVIPAYVLVGEFDRAVDLAEPMWGAWRRSGRPLVFWMQVTAHFLVLAHGLRGDEDEAARWRERVAAIASGPLQFRPRLAPLAAFVDIRVAVHRGEVAGARRLVTRAWEKVPYGRYGSYAHVAAAELAVVAGFPDAADLIEAARLDADQNPWAAACLARARGRLRCDPSELAAAAEAFARLGARWEHACTERLR